MTFAQYKFLLFLLLSIIISHVRAVLNFHDEDFFGHTADTYDWTKHPCRRNCTNENVPQTCRYVFVVEQFYAMSKACYNCPFNITDCYRPHCITADGVPKLIYTVNRQLPGPLIEVCEQDTIVVDVRNRMLSDSTTIHWHGFKQRGTPYMDGVPYVSQCPILPGENFHYEFKASDPGTFFYHSHMGNQRANGLFGPLIVKKLIQNERMSKLYDHDNFNVVVVDWSHKTGDEDFAKFYYSKLVTPANILINGLGRFRKFHTNDSKVLYTPSAIFEVEQGSRYRFRFIDAGYDDCPIVISIDNHTMLVISMDSNDIQPVEVDAITIWPGERTDVVVNADQKPDNYWIRFRGHNMCYDNATSGVYQAAILRYKGAEEGDPKTLLGYSLPSVSDHRVLNPYNVGTELKSKCNVDIPDLKALDPNDLSLNERADQQVYLSFDFHHIDNYDFNRKGLYGYNQAGGFGTLQFNHITLKLPPVPLMSQWDMLGPDPFCNATHLPKNKDCKTEQCACTHVIQLPKQSVIELVFVAEGPTKGPHGDTISLHPLHLHGHFFRVVAMEKLKGKVTAEEVKRLDREGKIKRRLDRAPLKDTIKAPHGGYTIVRFLTNNPGYWFFHCHFELHNMIGMALIFKVGEPKDFPPVPKHFPNCGKYQEGLRVPRIPESRDKKSMKQQYSDWFSTIRENIKEFFSAVLKKKS